MTTIRTARTRRPMITLTGNVHDLRVGDYVDTLGGITESGVHHKRYRVGALLESKALTDPAVWGRRNEEAYELTFLSVGAFGVLSACPVTFRRFTD